MRRARIVVSEGCWPETGRRIAEETLEWGAPLKAPDTLTMHQRGCDESDCINHGCLTIHLEDA